MYSDFVSPDKELANAKVEFNLSIKPLHFEDEKDIQLKLYVIVASNDITQKVEKMLTQNTYNITEVGIGYILKPFVKDIAFYKEVLVNNNENTTLKEEKKVKKEGVYYTYFIYEKIPKTAQGTRRNLRSDIVHTST